MSLVVFDNAEELYFNWLGNNPESLVLNTTRSHEPACLMIHIAQCDHISNPGSTDAGGFTEREHIKVGSESADEIVNWIAREKDITYRELELCKSCTPEYHYHNLKNAAKAIATSRLSKSSTGRVFGHIPSYPPGSTFASRQELASARVHPPPSSGISGSASEGADSIVLSGGYPDDEDHGDVIIYTGHGGRDRSTGKQISDQTLTRQNLALAVSSTRGLPVRVTRGDRHKSQYSPSIGYRYEGLYRVVRYWQDESREGYTIIRFQLEQTEYHTPIPPDDLTLESRGSAEPERVLSTVQRIVRDTQIAKDIKALHDYTCQACGLRLNVPSGPYAEAAHIRPLGSPHKGPDTPDNILCLCPNCHVLFDYGSISVDYEMRLIGELEGSLRIHKRHDLNKSHLEYHRERFFKVGL